MRTRFLSVISAILLTLTVAAQVHYSDFPLDNPASTATDSVRTADDIIQEALFKEMFSDTVPYDTLHTRYTLHKIMRLPVVYTNFQYADTAYRKPFPGNSKSIPALQWLEEDVAASEFEAGMLQRLFFKHPELVRYNMASLPAPAKVFHAVVDPSDHKITFHEVEIPLEEPTIKPSEVKKRHWIHEFASSLQFSQAYVSPNWYQGGNNNLNVLLNLNFNVKLNQEFHPRLLFETNVQYKLGLYSAPDDSLRNYSISEDLFQINSTFGVKAAKRWYYSVTLQFKTQLLNSYTSNTKDLRAALLSPGDLNVGLGMTYNYANPKKTVTFDASVAPLSYNMRTCITDRMDHEQFGIRSYRKTAHHFGSSAELKFMWQISSNIKYSSRLFGFTDYDRMYADWENTVVFEINKFLTTQLYAHLRYDTNTPPCDEGRWRKFQVKEILSIGFAYKFSTIK